MDHSDISENIITMKLDAIELSEKRPQRSSSLNAIKSLQHRLRKFFSEADGHGSFHRTPPPQMIKPQYFKGIDCKISCYPIKRMDWITLVNSASFKKKFILGDGSAKAKRPKAVLGSDNSGDKPHPSSPK